MKTQTKQKTIRCRYCQGVIIMYKGGWIHVFVKDFLSCPRAAAPAGVQTNETNAQTNAQTDPYKSVGSHVH